MVAARAGETGSLPGTPQDEAGSQRRVLIFWTCVLLVLVGGRLAAVDLLWGRVVGGDHAIYLALAGNLLAGHGLVVDDPNTLANMRATYPPGYPLLLALLGLVVPLTYATIAGLNTAVDTACAWVIYRVAGRVAPKPAGIAAAAIYLVWPAKLVAAPLAQKESLISLLVATLVLILMRSVPRPTVLLAILFGAVTGILALTQPGLAPLPALFLLVAFRKFEKGKWLRFVMISASASLVCLMPWWIRNWLVFDRFVPLTSAAGYGLWEGVTPHRLGDWTQPPDEFLRGDEFQMSRALAQDAWRIIISDPAQFVAHCFGKLVRAFSREGAATDVFYLALPQPETADVSKAWRFAATVVYLIVYLTGVAGALLRPRRLLSLLLFAGLLQILLFGIWLEFSERHRQFLTPLVLLSACTFVIDRYFGQSKPQPVRSMAKAPDPAV